MSDTLPARPVSRVMTRIKRDGQVRRAVRRLATIAPHLANPKYRPALQSLARITLLVDRAYQSLARSPSTATRRASSGRASTHYAE